MWAPTTGCVRSSSGLVEAGAVDLLRRDVHGDARLSRRTPGVRILAEVLLRELVDLLVGTLLGQLCATADRYPLVLIVGVDHQDRDPRVAAEVLLLRAPAR